MEVIYSTRAKEDFLYWKKNNSKMICHKVVVVSIRLFSTRKAASYKSLR